MGYSITKDTNGHWLVTNGPTGKPVALFYAHNVASHVALNRARKFVERMK